MSYDLILKQTLEFNMSEKILCPLPPAVIFVLRRYNNPCGQGAYFACSIDVASGYAKEKMGEKCVFVVRLNPTGTRVPEKETEYAIVNDSQNARPVGICIRRTAVEEKCTLM